MTRILTIIALLFASVLMPISVSANKSDCGDLGSLAENIMKLRQHGVPMSTMLDLPAKFDEVEVDAEVDEAEIEKVRKLMTDFIYTAFEEARYISEDDQNDAIIRFREKYEVECFLSERGNRKKQ